MLGTRNPFNSPYITEGISDARELLEHYSFHPFRHLHERVAAESNVILVGRRGIGKTMLLKLLDAELMRLIYRSPQLSSQRGMLPKHALGIYINLASPAIRVREFGSTRLTAEAWRLAFGDFVNGIVLEAFLDSFDEIAGLAGWPCRLETEALRQRLLDGLREESSTYDEVSSIEELRMRVADRTRSWVRFLNRDATAPPPVPLMLGLPLFRAVRAVRAVIPSFRLMVLVDQYEALHGHRAVLDLRPVFNQAMSEASRGGTGVEFKIGSRPYAYGDMGLIVGSGRLETGREVVQVNLDQIVNEYYDDFVADLFQKRLVRAGADNHPGLALERLPGLTAVEEAERYRRNARTETARHLIPITERWVELGVEAPVAESVIDSVLKPQGILVSVLTGIALARWLRDSRKHPPFGLQQVDGNLDAQLAEYGRQIAAALERRYAKGTAIARKGAPADRAADDLVQSHEPIALFRIASSYKNQTRYYCGFETIARVSSNVALVFVEIMKAACDMMLLKELDPVRESIPVEVQRAAVYSVSESWQRKIATEYDNGVLQDRFVRGLGASLRELQVELTSTVPTPNGFSISSSDFSAAEGIPEAELALGRVLELVEWGLLEESEHQDKTRRRPPRRKFLINRVLCPYFRLSELRLKDPVYVRDVSSFVNALLNAAMPTEYAEALAAGRGSNVPTPGHEKQTKQRTLF